MIETFPDIVGFLETRLERGTFQLGQVDVHPGFCLTHHDDHGRADLTTHSDPHEAIEIAKYDDAGNYRPLKTAPNLRRGWRLHLADSQEVRLALDFLYPAAIGTLAALEIGPLRAVPLRETLARQTGMYAVVKKITDDQAEGLVTTLCRPGCLRRIAWKLEAPVEINAHSASADLPIYCLEACNIFIGEGRKVVKGKAS